MNGEEELSTNRLFGSTLKLSKEQQRKHSSYHEQTLDVPLPPLETHEGSDRVTTAAKFSLHLRSQLRSVFDSITVVLPSLSRTDMALEASTSYPISSTNTAITANITCRDLFYRFQNLHKALVQQ